MDIEIDEWRTCHLGLAKCVLWPSQLLRYLGLLLNLLGASVAIPQDKLAKFEELGKGVEVAPQDSRRLLARLAALLVSFYMAVPLGPLYTQQLFQALAGVADWDALFAPEVELRQHIAWLRRYIPQHNGKRWWCRQPGVLLVTDASVFAVGGAAVRLSHDPAAERWITLQGQLSPTLQQQSSTCREVAAMHAAAAACPAAAP